MSLGLSFLKTKAKSFSKRKQEVRYTLWMECKSERKWWNENFDILNLVKEWK